MEPETKEERWKKADKLIEKGYAATDIGREIGVSHVAVHKYLKRSGKYEEWKEKRKEGTLPASEKSLEELARGIGAEIQDLSLEESLEELARGIGAEIQDLSLEEYQQALSTPDDIERAVLEVVRRDQIVHPNELYRKLGLIGMRDMVYKILRKHQISMEQNRYCPVALVKAEAEIYLGLEPKGDYSKKRRESVLKCVLEDHPVTIYQIQQKTGIESETILNILKDEKLVTFIPHRMKRKPELDELIAQGLTLREMSQLKGVTGERIRQLILAEGKYDYRKEQRRKRKLERSNQKNALHQARQELTSLLVDRAYQRCDEGGWKYRRKALDYYFGRKVIPKKGNKASIPLEKLLTLFETYEMAGCLGVKLSLEELEERTGIGFPHIGRILRSQGLEPMYGTREKSSPLSPELNRAIERAYATGFTSVDVAYFLGLSRIPWVVLTHFAEIRKSGAEKINQKKRLFCTKQTTFERKQQKGDTLFYRTASQIYELDDMARGERMSFPNEEVAKLLEIRLECVEYARRNRGWIEYDLKRLLRILYPDKRVEKPYL